MKKVFLAAMICLVFVGTTQAQYKPEAMSVTTEVQFTPFNSNDQLLNNNLAFRGRLFIVDNMAIRLTLGYGLNTDKTVTYLNNDDYSTCKIKNSTFMLGVGYEYHFKGAERISPFVGAELGIGFGKETDTDDNSVNDDKSITTYKGLGLSANILAGVDFYVYKGLYLGAEIGFGYSSVKYGNGSTEVTIGGTTVNTDIKDYNKESQMGFNCNPALRLGWKF